MAPAVAPRRQKRRAGFATKREALAALTELQQSVERGTFIAPSAITVGDFLEAWLPSAEARLRSGTYAACVLHVRSYIVPRIGRIALQDLATVEVKALYADLRARGRVRSGGPLAAKTVHNIHRTLSRALDDAVADRLILSNPAVRAHRQPQSQDMPTWSATQLRAFLDHTAADEHAALWRLAATTGMRRGEIVGLEWSDVDFAAGRISVVRQRAKAVRGVASGPTKTRRSRRLVSLERHDGRAAGGAPCGAKHPGQRSTKTGSPDLAFTLATGRPIHPDRLTQLFREHCADAELPYIRFHGLRHTHATLMLRAGVHPKVVQERLGHSSIAITLDTYSHAVPSMQEEAAERAAALLDGLE